MIARTSSLPAKPAARAKLAASALSAVAVLAGCAIGPDYQRPEGALPEQWKTAAPAAEANALLKTDWWTLFRDPVLDRLVESALVANQDLLAAVARMEAAEGAAREAGASYFPTIGAEGGANRSRTSGETVTGKQTGSRLVDDRRAALTLSYEVDLWGRIRRSNEAARAQALASRYGRDALRLSLLGQLTNEYLSLRSYDAQLIAATQTLEARRESLRIVEARAQAGSASDLDLAQARSALAASEAQVVQTRRLRALSENQIGLLTGEPGLRIESGTLDTLPLPPVPPAGLPSALIDARPDVRQAEEALIAANARIGVAKAAYFPTISLTGNYGSESAALASLFTGSAGIWTAAISLAMPIFDAGRTGARVDQATAAQRESLASYRKTLQTAFREVADAIVNLDEYAKEESALATQSASAKRALDLAQLRYDSGYVGYIEVLDAQRTFNAAQQQQIASRRNRLGASVDLFKALGGGWQPEDGAPAGPEGQSISR